MYVRDAKNREEVWLLDRIEELELDDTAFRSRDYVVAVDETTNDKAGFGRIRIHQGDPEYCELTSIGVLREWRDQGVGAHIIERLLEHASDQDFETVYALTDAIEYLQQFGFEPIDTAELPPVLQDRLAEKREHTPDAIGMAIESDAFEMPDRLREAFKRAGRQPTDADDEDTGEDVEELQEEFGIDPDEATYKYDLDG